MGRKRDSELNNNLEALEKRIEQCRVLYELWFNGVEKREPTWHRQEILRQLTRFRRNSREITNAVDRFRLRNIQARFNSLTQYWNRIILQRERGTYHKDIARMRRRMGSQSVSEGAGTPAEGAAASGEAAPRAHSLDVGEAGDAADLSQSLAEAAAQAAASSAVSAASGASGASRREPGVTAGPAVPDVGGPSEQRIQQLYRTYLKARERTNESTNVSFDAVSRSIQSQVPKLREKGYNDFDFKVVIQNGKAAIRPVAKKK